MVGHIVASSPSFLKSLDALGSATVAFNVPPPLLRDHELQDAVLNAKVQAALHAESELLREPIDALARNGEVQLTGYVRSVGQRQLAGNVAAQVGGVTKLDNQLVVR